MNIISDQKVFFLVILKQKIVNQNIKCYLILPWQFHQNPQEANITFFPLECYYCWIILLWIVELKLLGLELKPNTLSFKVQSLFKNTLIQCFPRNSKGKSRWVVFTFLLLNTIS